MSYSFGVLCLTLIGKLPLLDFVYQNHDYITDINISYDSKRKHQIKNGNLILKKSTNEILSDSKEGEPLFIEFLYFESNVR